MRAALVLLALAAVLPACDGGFAPPATTPGAIRGTVRYAGPWPPADSLVEVRFVAMRFIPRDTTDFLQLNNLVFSPQKLRVNVDAGVFVVPDVPPGRYVYAGVAQRYAASLFAWRPVGLVEGAFTVPPGDTARVTVEVDFRRLPPFPPR